MPNEEVAMLRTVSCRPIPSHKRLREGFQDRMYCTPKVRHGGRRKIAQTGNATGEYEDFLTGFVVDNQRVWEGHRGLRSDWMDPSL
jgi:hypothetical protein